MRYDKIIEELAKLEMQEGTHSTMLEDFSNKLDFYLENVTRDSYVTDFLPQCGIDLSNYNLYDVQSNVIKYIEANIED